jgi:hypothetical protein
VPNVLPNGAGTGGCPKGAVDVLLLNGFDEVETLELPPDKAGADC